MDILIVVIAFFIIVAACKSPDAMMRRPTSKPWIDPGDPDAGRDRLFSWVDVIANWMFVATVLVLALGFLLHNCKDDFTPLMFR